MKRCQYLSVNGHDVICTAANPPIILGDIIGYSGFTCSACKQKFDELKKKQNDEISEPRKELLKRQNIEETFSKDREQFDKKMLKQVKQERAEAIKEFAERLKKEVDFVDTTRKLKQTINNLVKEMTESEVS